MAGSFLVVVVVCAVCFSWGEGGGRGNSQYHKFDETESIELYIFKVPIIVGLIGTLTIIQHSVGE